MGDVQEREPRRNLIVTSTPTTDIPSEEEKRAESTIVAEKENTQPLSPSRPATVFPEYRAGSSQEGSSNMYGPTIAVYPQWQQMSHQPGFMPQHAHTRFVQSSFQSQQNTFNIQSLQRSLPSHHQPQPQQHSQQQQYPGGPSPQPIPYSAGQSHSYSQLYGMPGYNAAFYDPYNQGYNSPPAAQQSQAPQQSYLYSSSYPPQSHSATVSHSQGYMSWSGIQSQVNPYYYISQFQQHGQLSPQQVKFPPQPAVLIPYGSRRQSVPPNSQRFGTDFEGHIHGHPAEAEHAHLPGYRASNSPRGMGTSRGKRHPPPSVGIPGKSASPSAYSASVAGCSSASAPPALHPSLPRGPPRKPKQSGHALWVGNLPPGTNVVALKDYFSTEDIESVFLISKSNCAFINYRTEAACSSAMAKFHDSRFQGVRLVCRLRRNSSPGTAGTSTPTTPAANNSSSEQLNEDGKDAIDGISEPSHRSDAKEPSSPILARSGKERFFIVKSLTVEDLDLSVRNGVWATQAHNENVLNAAYQSAGSVFLIFSANKSGEYYGYARMSSAISEEVASKIEWAPVAHTADDPDLPKAIFTPATDTAPKGRIIDDSARGTIFWEAIDENASDEESSEGTESGGERTSLSKSWGKPFRVEWISTSKVPFYRTRGLRNPYNVSREVKIARDGTELEPSVGRRLVQMFHRGGLGAPSGPVGPARTNSVQIDAILFDSRAVTEPASGVEDFSSSPGLLETPIELTEQVQA